MYLGTLVASVSTVGSRARVRLEEFARVSRVRKHEFAESTLTAAENNTIKTHISSAQPLEFVQVWKTVLYAPLELVQVWKTVLYALSTNRLHERAFGLLKNGFWIIFRYASLGLGVKFEP